MQRKQVKIKTITESGNARKVPELPSFSTAYTKIPLVKCVFTFLTLFRFHPQLFSLSLIKKKKRISLHIPTIKIGDSCQVCTKYIKAKPNYSKASP